MKKISILIPVYNVSYIDEAYKPAFEPLVLDIDLVDHHVKI